MQMQTQEVVKGERPLTATGEMAVMGRDGDSKHFWNKDAPIEVKIAKKVFKQYEKKGYRAFSMTEKGDQGELMNEFDPEAGCILFMPPMAGG